MPVTWGTAPQAAFGGGPRGIQARLIGEFDRESDLEEPGVFYQLDFGDLSNHEAIGLVMSAIYELGLVGDLGEYDVAPGNAWFGNLSPLDSEAGNSNSLIRTILDRVPAEYPHPTLGPEWGRDVPLKTIGAGGGT